MMDYKSIAKQYGITEKIEALEKALLSISGVEKVDFDLNGYLDDIYQVIIIPKYSVSPVDWKSNRYYEKRKELLDSILKAVRKTGLRRTEDRIEDMGEHFYIVLSSTRWNDNREFALFYDNNGIEIPVGSEGWGPNRAIANRLLSYHEGRSVLDGREIYIKERQKQMLCTPMKRFNGKLVYNKDHCYFNALKVGDFIGQDVYNYIVNCITPACTRSDCTQLGEAAATKIDENGNEKNVYETIKKVADGIYEYCGRCFRGENTERGVYPSYI